MEFEIKKYFDSYLISTFKSESIRNYLLNHERKQRCIDRVCEQIRMAELGQLKQRMDIWRWRTLVEACAKIFANAALQHAEESALTQAEKMRRIDEATRIDQIAAEFEAEQMIGG
jgi:hypothetical protein